MSHCSFSDWADDIDPEGGTLGSEMGAKGAPTKPHSRTKHKTQREKSGGPSVPSWSDSAVFSLDDGPPGGSISSVGQHVPSVTHEHLCMVPVGESWAHIFKGWKTPHFSDRLEQSVLFMWFDRAN